ncbi:MAG: hypothetical protein JWN61_701 [Pseudonocardiales bacterium]|nr:hypothetical protein [Pseudonocardiales bacterium]
MSGGGVVSIRGGIDVRTDDLRAAAQIMSELGLTLRQGMDNLRISAANALMYNEDAKAQLEQGGLARARGAADEAARLAGSLRATADRYDEGESRIERMAGDAVALLKDGTKARVRMMSLGLLDTPWPWDPRAVEPGAQLFGKLGFGGYLIVMAAVLDWRGHPIVTSTGVDASTAGTTPPRDIADLLANVERLGAEGDSDVSVQFLEFDDGRPRQVIVSLPGTSQWSPGSDIPSDIAAGPLAIEGLPTAYGAGVVDMLALAGVTAADSILIVGHSLGGIVAAQLAVQLAGSRRFNVTNVVTAGSPIAKIDIPEDVEVVALENRDDLVPHLDGGPNEGSGNVLTITVDTGATGSAAHVLDTGYAPAADAITGSDAPRVQHALEGLQPFLDADRSTTLTYSIARP